MNKRLAVTAALFLLLAAAMMAQTAVAPLHPPIDVWADAPAKDREVIGRVDALVAGGLWKSGWDLLVAADPAHSPWILARSIGLALDGQVGTEMHRAFTIIDLPEGSKPEQLRGMLPEAGSIEFDPAALADEQAKAGTSAVPALDRALGRYWVEVSGFYPGSWFIADQEIALRLTQSLARAREAGAWDLGSLVSEAEALLNLGEAPMAEALLVSAEVAVPSSPNLRYDHAIALLMQDRAAEAIPIVDAGLAMDGDEGSKVSALSLGAQAATQAGDLALAESYLATAEALVPDRSDPGIFRHYLAVMSGNKEGALAAADRLIATFGADPQIIAALVGDWFRTSDFESAKSFLDAGLARFAKDDAGAAAFGFYKAVVLIQTAAQPEELQAAQAALTEATARFALIFPPEHQVFGVIAGLKSQIEQGLDAMLGPAEGPMVPPTP